MFVQGDGVRAQSAPVVRRCSKCEQPAVVLVHDWQHTGAFGTATGQSTRDYRCQNCGKKYRVRPRLQTILGLWVGVMAASTIIGIPVFIVFWRRHTVPRRILPVPGAPMPPIRFADGPPQRACGGSCAASSASVIKVTRHTHNGIPAGTEYIYRCAGCSREFTVHSVGGIASNMLVALVMVGATAAFVVFAETPGWRWGGSGVSVALALLMFGSVVSQIRTRSQHPIVDTGLG